MKFACIALSLLFHSLFFIKFSDGPMKQVVTTTAREVIAIKVKEVRKPKKKFKSKKNKKVVKENLKESTSDNLTKLVEAESKSIIKPVYPERARLLGFEGRATVLATIGENGQIISVELVKSSGYEILDNEIIRSVKNAVFVAASRNGTAIKSEKEITFNYELE